MLAATRPTDARTSSDCLHTFAHRQSAAVAAADVADLLAIRVEFLAAAASCIHSERSNNKKNNNKISINEKRKLNHAFWFKKKDNYFDAKFRMRFEYLSASVVVVVVGFALVTLAHRGRLCVLARGSGVAAG